ncbi:MAG: hypothetical protein AAB731_04545, partial [Patescibacteria group bacterium]
MSKKDCATGGDADCSAREDSNLQINSVKLAPAPLDKNTCWSEADKQFVCPAGSHVYQYQNLGGSDYNLRTDFEYADNVVNLWGGRQISPSSTISGVCTSAAYGTSSVCGDGIIGTGEQCELGQTRDGDCSGGKIKQVCNSSCSGWVAAPGATCAVFRCGDGVIQSPTEKCDDGVLNGKYGYCKLDCSGSGRFCGDGIVSGEEKCDCGAVATDQLSTSSSVPPNQLKKFDGTPCVTGKLNGQQNSGCSWDCAGPGLKCGDGIKQNTETCDGNVNTTKSEILGVCNNGAPGTCRADANCNNVQTNFALTTTNLFGIAFDGTNLWAADMAGNRILKINAEDRSIISVISINRPYSIIFDGRYLWTANADDQSISKIDPVGATVLNTYKFNSASYNFTPNSLAFDGVYLWSANGADSPRIVKIDPATGSVVAAYDNSDFAPPNPNFAALGEVKPMGITFDGANLWLADFASKRILKVTDIDSTSMKLQPVPLQDDVGAGNHSPNSIFFNSADGYLWTANNDIPRTISRINPVSTQRSSYIYSNDDEIPQNITSARGALWITSLYRGNYNLSKIYGIDGSGKCVGFYPACAENKGYFVGFDPAPGTYDTVMGGVPIAAGPNKMKFEAGAGITGSYTLKINTQNAGGDLTNASYGETATGASCTGAGCGECNGAGIYHHLKVLVDNGQPVAYCAPA